MEVICDTNIWYYLGNGIIDKTIMDEFELIGIYNSAAELCYSFNHLNRNSENIKNAIYAFINFSSKKIFKPPFIYLKNLDDPSFEYNEFEKHHHEITFLELIAEGRNIKKDEIENFKKILIERKKGFDIETERINFHGQQTKDQNGNKSYNWQESIHKARSVTNQLVNEHSKSGGLSSNFKWDNIKVFESFLAYTFYLVGKGAFTFKNNDWYDLFNHAYVTKNRKYLTSDKKKWKKVSKDTCLSHFIVDCDNYKKPHFR